MRIGRWSIVDEFNPSDVALASRRVSPLLTDGGWGRNAYCGLDRVNRLRQYHFGCLHELVGRAVNSINCRARTGRGNDIRKNRYSCTNIQT